MRPTRDEMERRIREANGNLTRTAERLGVSRPTVYKWIWQLGLQKVAGLTPVAASTPATSVDGVYVKHIRKYVKPGDPIAPRLTVVSSQAAAQEQDYRRPRSVSIRGGLWLWAQHYALDTQRSAADVVEEALSMLRETTERKAKDSK